MDVFDAIADVSLGQEASWRDLAACGHGDLPPGYMFPEERDDVGTRRAKAVCAGCTEHEACHALWITLPSSLAGFGVWFGSTPKERRRDARVRRLAAHQASVAAVQELPLTPDREPPEST